MYKKSLYGILVRYSKNVEICFVKIDIGNKFMNIILEYSKLNKKKVAKVVFILLLIILW